MTATPGGASPMGRRRWWPVIVAGLAVLTGVVLIGAAAVRTAGPAGGALTGQAAPSVVLASLSGEGIGVDTGALRGRAYVLNFYASWCAPCIEEHPQLMALAASGTPIYGVAWRDGAEEAQAFLDARGDPYIAVGFDQNGLVGRRFGVQGAPETFVVGADGVVVVHWRGAITPDDLGRVITPAWRRAVAVGRPPPDP